MQAWIAPYHTKGGTKAKNEKFLHTVVTAPSLPNLPPFPHLCKQKFCSALMPGELLLGDPGHAEKSAARKDFQSHHFLLQTSGIWRKGNAQGHSQM